MPGLLALIGIVLTVVAAAIGTKPRHTALALLGAACFGASLFWQPIAALFAAFH